MPPSHNQNRAGFQQNFTPSDGFPSTTELSFRADKVGHIINNWKLKFSGSSDGLAVENFIYRVEAAGNFEILCRHVSILFDGKACHWFLRFHRSVKEIKWNELCNELKLQFKDS